jgi:hypothetical protein
MTGQFLEQHCGRGVALDMDSFDELYLKPDSDVFQAVTDSLDSLIDRSPTSTPSLD